VQVLGGIHLGTGDIELLDNPLLGVNAGARAIIALALLGRYLSLSFFPFPLSADYSYAVIDPVNFWVNPENLLGLVIVFCIAAAGFANRKQNSALWFFTCWFFLSFAVTANLLFPIGTVFAERLAYLPSVGTAGILALLIMRLPLPSLRFGGLTLLLGAYALMSWHHIPVWKDNTSLHTYQIGVSSQSAKTLHNYAVVLRNRGKLDEALFMFHQALDRYSHFADAAFGLGSVYLLKGIFGGAEHWFNEALKIDPQHQASLTFLARIYRLQGHKTEAENLEKRITDKANKK
jgi:tetratricopeptide (TPR) repeat protein